MLDSYLQSVRQELFRRGIWGRQGGRITEELSDHYRCNVEARLKEGEWPASAERQALQALGTAETVAEAAAETVRAGSWLARYPWVLAGGGVFLVSLIGVVVMFCMVPLTLWLLGDDALVEPFLDNQATAVLFNWLPFVLGCCWLGWWAQRSPGSWKALILASLSIGFASSTFWCVITPALHGPHSGSAILEANNWLALTVKLSALVFPVLNQYGSHVWPAVVNGLLLRALLPVSAVLAFRYLMLRRQEEVLRRA